MENLTTGVLCAACWFSTLFKTIVVVGAKPIMSSAILYDQFKAFLKQLVNDPDVIRKNAALSDSAYKQDILDRIDAQNPETSIVQDVTNALTPTYGMMSKDPARRSLVFDPVGFITKLSAFREGTVSNPSKFFRRPDNDVYGVRYILADRGTGLMMLNQELEVLNRFPVFGPITVSEYNDASAVCTFDVGGTEYLAVTSYSHHICQIYLYDPPYTYQATIGTLDTPGATPALLYNPVGIAVDEANNLLFILNENGTPAGATLDRGFVTVFDISNPAAPVNVGIPMYYDNTGSLLDGEVDNAADIFFDPLSSLLWVVNGSAKNEAASYTVSGGGTTLNMSNYIESSGAGYTLREPKQLYVQTQLGGYKRIFIANGATGTIEVFDQATLNHLGSYGYRASEDELSGYDRLSDAVYGAIGFPQAVIADTVYLDGKNADVFIVGDNINRRLHRFNTNAYTENNWINFELMELSVPVSLYGWSCAGTIPPDMMTVYYRFDETEEFRELPQETNTPPSSTFQFRVAVQLDTRRFVRPWKLDKLRIHATQV